MSIAELPPQNHINSLRSFIGRIRRTRIAPTRDELDHADDMVNALEAVLKKPTQEPA
jgi:hypothetical protein